MNDMQADEFFYTPGLGLLDENVGGTPADPAELERVHQTIIDTLAEFGIAVAPGDITKGPTITSYEIYPALGVRMGQIRGLEPDLARTMRVEQIASIAPVPGKGTIAVNLPNRERSIVSARSMLQNVVWMETAARVPLALGRNTQGEPVIADLAAMPHLLIGGMPGSGKSALLDAIIVNLLFRFSPDELRLILIDPHYAQMQVYNDLPHLIIPVITDAPKVLLALRHVAIELENRLSFFAAAGVQDMAEFNARAPAKRSWFARDTPMPERLPYLVVIIDELTDLFHSGPAEIETLLEQITEVSAAAGIHFIIAAKPAFERISALLKARAPGRIALQVRSEEDSYAIIDADGAERLLGNGEMLCLTPANPQPERVQGMFVTEEEIHRVVEFVSAQAPPSFTDAAHQASYETPMLSAEDEELVEMCLEVIRPRKARLNITPTETAATRLHTCRPNGRRSGAARNSWSG